MFEQIPSDALQTLRANLARGTLSAPLTVPALLANGLGVLAKHQPALENLDAKALMLLCDAVLKEREKQTTDIELVWTGPEGRTAAARSTFVVFRDLLASAQKSVWMAGYAIDHGAELFAPLHKAMTQRNVRATFLLNLEAKVHRSEAVHEKAVELINRFRSENWPFAGPFPRFFYDPRSLQARTFASMHAKTLVVDEKHTLIGSANFTSRGQSRNIEAGALIHDEGFAKNLVTQFQSLIDGGVICPYQ
ncbi:MAG: hypothetical protein IPJ88_04665 [Myxococcales bacterium]|nr:MAG: hypothetical protein IPJ88_04665 [Myxococcales bacterium]